MGRRLKAARQVAGLTQEELAARTGIDYKRIQRLEGGRVNATVRTLVLVATTLKMDFWALLSQPSR